MGNSTPDPVGGDRPDSIDLEVVGPDETLHRRIHPTRVKSNGSVSSGAFKDPEMSVDRAALTDVKDTMEGYSGYALAAFVCQLALDLEQEVRPAPELLNKGHTLIIGAKPKSVARAFARQSSWVIAPN